MMRTGRFRSGVIILGTLLLPIAMATAWAGPGDLDRSFGRRGKVTSGFTPRDDHAMSVALQDDGKIITAGTAARRRFALARHTRNGMLDPTFGGDGRVTTWFGGGLTSAHAVAIQPDGKVLAAGGAYGEDVVAVARYHADGTLDDTFDGDGMVTTSVAGHDAFARDVALQADGRVVVAGAAGFSHFVLIRYEPDGSLDASFGQDGVVLTDLTAGWDSAFAIAIQDDGRILAAGRASGARGRFGLARYAPDGTLDPDFGRDGAVFTNFSRRDDAARDVTVQPNGRIVVAGYAGYSSARKARFALARYLPDGSLDPTFRGNGKVTTRFSEGLDLALGVAVHDRRIVAAGHAGGTTASPRDHRFAMARYRLNGRLDRAFGEGGRTIVNFTAGDDWANDVAIRADGRVIAAGRSSRAGGSFALVRLSAG